MGTEQHTLVMYTVYDHPHDFPEEFVARRFEITAHGPRPKELVGTAPSLQEVRLNIPSHLVRLERDPFDDPKIVEVWI